MPTLELKWQGPYRFKDLLSEKTSYQKFNGPGVYVHVRRSDGERVYVGRAGGRPSLIARQVRHYLGSIGLLYAIEPRLTKKKASAEDFEKATSLLRNPDLFAECVRAEFTRMDELDVYLAACDKDRVRSVEAVLHQTWSLPGQQRKERDARASSGHLVVRHLPAKPGRA